MKLSNDINRANDVPIELSHVLCRHPEFLMNRTPDCLHRAAAHAGATIMDRINVPTSAIQTILDHENRTTTEICLHSLGDAERIAIAAYGQARNGREFSHGLSHKMKRGYESSS